MTIAEDVDAIAQSVDDRYYVSGIKVKFQRDEASPAIRAVQFERGLVSSGASELTLREIVTLCTKVLGYSIPEVRDAIGELVTP